MKAVCRFDKVKNNSFVGGGSGFHLGDGWIQTNSHVVGEEDLKQLQITFDNVEPPIHFRPRFRPCFYKKIEQKQNGGADVENPDLAFVYVGWEDEVSGLPAMDKWVS